MIHSIIHSIKWWLTILLLAIGIHSSYAEIIQDGIKYTLSSSQAKVTGYNSSQLSKNVVIPSEIKSGGSSYTVTVIEQSAFEDCKKLESISIPGTVTRLGQVKDSGSDNPNSDHSSYVSVFKDCTNLKKVRFEDGEADLKIGSTYCRYSNVDGNLGRGMFADCPLEEIYLGRNLIGIDHPSGYNYQSYPDRYGYSPFCNQSKLINVNIGPNVTSLPDYLFYKCSNIQNYFALDLNPPTAKANTFPSYTSTLYVPNNVKSKYQSATYWKEFTNQVGMIAQDGLLFIPAVNNEVSVTKWPNTSPEQLVFPASVSDDEGKEFVVSKVLDNAFKDCADLTLVSFPASIVEIGENAFASNPKLASITFNGQKIIGQRAFYNCPSITSLTLPNTLETIGEQAFYKNTSITSVTFGNGLKQIGDKAFANCSALTAIKLPDSISEIGESAFEDCRKLTYATLGTSLTTLAKRAFYRCNVLTEISIPGTVVEVGGSAFEKCTNLTLATLSNGTETIGVNVFKDCSSLLTISVPGSVTVIGDGCFDGCTSLSSASFLAGEEPIKIAHFQDSPLKTVRIGRNLVYTWGENSSPFYNKITLKRALFTGNFVTELYYNLFDGCSGIESITLPQTLETIRDRAFKNCSGLTSISIPDNTSVIGSYAFENCTSLPEVTLPASLAIVENYLFHNCASLKSVILQEGQTRLKTHCFDNCNVLETISIPSTVTNIEDYSFEMCGGLKSLTFVDGNTSLNLATKASMFRDCPLDYMFVGRNIDYIDSNSEVTPFYNQNKLTTVQISDAGGVTYLRSYFLNGASSLKSLSIPDNVNYVNKYAFANCSALELVSLSNTLISLDKGLFKNDVSLKSLIIPASVTSVEQEVLGNCTSLADLKFMDSGNSISLSRCESGLGMCAQTSLENLYIGRNLSYSYSSDYGYSPFKNVKTLKSVVFTDKGHVTKCDNYLFQGCSGVVSLNLPESLKTIGTYTFQGMTSLEYCRMYNNVETVGEYCFAEDEKLNDLTFSTKVKTLRRGLFQNCRALPTFTVHAAVTSIEDNAFLNTTSLVSLSFTDSSELLSIGQKNDSNRKASMFADSPLKSLYLSRWLNYDISDETCSPFYNQAELTDLRFGNTLGDIGKYLFEKCSSVAEVNIPGVESIGEKAFYQCVSLSDLTMNEGTNSIGEQSFAECTSLRNVSLPSSVISLSDRCFSNDINLTTADLGNSLEIIGPGAFSGCVALQELNLPSSVYGLGVESFKGCVSLPYITIPQGCKLSSIGAKAFQGCTGVEWVSLSDRITSLGSMSFDGCNSIRYIKSFNLIPPVGLPTFTQDVLDNATLFVPADALADYTDADIWFEFFDIKPIGDGVFVSYLDIDKNEVTLKATQTAQILAEVGPENATNREVGYLSDNMSVATVDDSGLVKAIAVGEANIKAYAKDGSGFYKKCKVTVVPTLMESLVLNDSQLEMKVNRKTKLTAEITPATTTDQSIIWRSNNSSIASVDENGEISSHNKGTATITATAADGSGVVATCVLTVIPPTKGDSNDNDVVTITDAVNTANYAVGNDVADFCFEAADVNGDNRITLADASGTVTEVLNQPVTNSALAIRRVSIDTQIDSEFDKLVIDDYDCKNGETVYVNVALDNTLDYVALQADITVPEGMTIEGVELGARAEANHSLMQRRIDDRTMRVALFDLNNAPFADIDEPILVVAVKPAVSDCGDIVMNNILASDAEANEYMLHSTGGHNTLISGVDYIYGDGSIKIEADEDGVTIYNADGKEARIYALDGRLLAQFAVYGNATSRRLESGVYVVVVDDVTANVMVK